MSKIIRFSPLGDPERSTPTPDRIVHGQPEQLLWNVYSDPKGWFHVGRWSSTPGSWRVQYTENELCHLLSGRIRLRDAEGTAYDFGAGDTFVICSGFAGVWEVLEPCVKLYAIYDPQ